MDQRCGCGGIGLIVLIVVLICAVGLVATCTPGLVAWSPVALASRLADDAEAAPAASSPADQGVVEAPLGDSSQQEAAASQPAASESAAVHVVARGDTLIRLAARFGTTVEAIKAANGLTSAKIVVAQKLVIPVVPKPHVTAVVTVCPTPTPCPTVCVPVCPTPAPVVVVPVCPPPVVVVPVCPPPVVVVPVCPPPVVCVPVCPAVSVRAVDP